MAIGKMDSKTQVADGDVGKRIQIKSKSCYDEFQLLCGRVEQRRPDEGLTPDETCQDLRENCGKGGEGGMLHVAQKETRLDKHNGSPWKKKKNGKGVGSLIYLKAAAPKLQTNDI